MKEFIKKNVLIILILLISIYFRFAGINSGYPRHTDEGGYASALTMIWKGNMDPGRYDYPSGVALINYTIFKGLFQPIGWIKYYYTNLDKILDGYIKLPLNKLDFNKVLSTDIWGVKEINAMYWGRYITAVFGVGIVFLVYLISKKLYGKKVGLVASFLTAVNYRQVLNSHIGLPDIYNAFFLCLVIFFVVKIYKSDRLKYYLLAGISSGLYFSIKFQFFGLLPLIWVFIVRSCRNIFSIKKIIVALIAFGLVVLILNPYLLIKFETFMAIQKYQFLKYGAGSNSFFLYPYWYLYNFGIGQILSILAILGIIIALFKYPVRSTILLLPIFQSLYTFTFYSHGGFYTRNFVTVTPLILIFAALLIVKIIKKTIYNKHIVFITIIIVTLFVSFDNILKSLAVIKEYKKPWNEIALLNWEKKNIPNKSIILAHGDVPIPEETTRKIFDFDQSFSIDEFINDGADFAISNSSWSTNSFYWWISSSSREFYEHYWVKPLQILEYSYPALALRELESFSIAEFEKDWVAPDTFFTVAKIPKYRILKKTNKIMFDLSKDISNFKKEGYFWLEENNLSNNSDGIIIETKPSILPSVRWESVPLDVSTYNGLVVDYEIISSSDFGEIKSGYIVLNYYKNLEDANNSQNRLMVRISKRNIADNKWKNESLISGIPSDARFVRIGFASFDPQRSLSAIRKIVVNDAMLEIDFSGYKVLPSHVDQNNMFPNSHGNL